MKPSLGRIVIVQTPQQHNGANEHPAIITRVWQDESSQPYGGHTIVNVTVIPDGAGCQPYPMSSLSLFNTPEEAHASGQSHIGWWPPRV